MCCQSDYQVHNSCQRPGNKRIPHSAASIVPPWLDRPLCRSFGRKTYPPDTPSPAIRRSPTKLMYLGPHGHHRVKSVEHYPPSIIWILAAPAKNKTTIFSTEPNKAGVSSVSGIMKRAVTQFRKTKNHHQNWSSSQFTGPPPASLAGPARPLRLTTRQIRLWPRPVAAALFARARDARFRVGCQVGRGDRE